MSTYIKTNAFQFYKPIHDHQIDVPYPGVFLYRLPRDLLHFNPNENVLFMPTHLKENGSRFHTLSLTSRGFSIPILNPVCVQQSYNADCRKTREFIALECTHLGKSVIGIRWHRHVSRECGRCVGCDVKEYMRRWCFEIMRKQS